MLQTSMAVEPALMVVNPTMSAYVREHDTKTHTCQTARTQRRVAAAATAAAGTTPKMASVGLQRRARMHTTHGMKQRATHFH